MMFGMPQRKIVSGLKHVKTAMTLALENTDVLVSLKDKIVPSH